MVSKRDEVGEFEAGAEFGGRTDLRDQEAGRALDAGIGQAQARKVEDRNAADAELGVFEVELAFEVVVDNAARADFPERR